MYKLSRVFLHNLGVDGGLYFDDFELDFNDENNNASHFLIDTENGGGKTTIISLIYTALLPDKKDFIQSLRPNSKIIFDNYVQDELGFIMLELEKEDVNIFNSKEKLIIMQSLMKNSSAIARNFYTFIPSSFNYDDCKEFVKTLKDLKKLKDKLNENTANFAFITDSNSKHVDYLCQNYGFDKDILKLYAKFNSEEGAIANCFNFKTVQDFLAKLFFLLTDNTSRNDLLNDIKNHKDNINKKPELENDIDLLKNKISENEKYKEFYAYKKVEIDIKNLEQENKIKASLILDNEIKIHSINTLKEQNQYDELQKSHREKEDLLNKENQDLKPFANSLNNAKNKLSSKLGYEIKQLENCINNDKNQKKTP